MDARVVRGILSFGAAVAMAALSAGICNAGEAAAAGKGRSIHASGLTRQMPGAHKSGLSEIYPCPVIKVPPQRLQTSSKYRSDDSSKSSIDGTALEARDKAVQPIRESIRSLTSIAYDRAGHGDAMKTRAECVLSNLERWAAAGSLTDMASSDAYLTRDRWIAEIALALNFASRGVELTGKRKRLYSAWLGSIARDTIDAYTLRLGPRSRTNNHRYWAGLSVAAVGFVVGDQGFKQWGKASFEIGACQVDDHGFLPAELARGERALEYHVYALRPLAAILKLAADNGEPIQPRCLEGYERLTVQTRNSLKSASEFQKAAGTRQTTNIHEGSYSDALKLDGLNVFHRR
jgi:hypothetical protein